MEGILRNATPEDRAQLARLPGAAQFLFHQFLVLVVENAIASFLAWRRVAGDECEILQLETVGRFQRRGFARRLLQEFQKQEQCVTFLEVRKSNVFAIKLYQSAGFTHVGVRRGYYSFPTEDGIVLSFYPC